MRKIIISTIMLLSLCAFVVMIDTVVGSSDISGEKFRSLGQKVILNADFAELYDVTTKRLNKQVKRDQDQFPEDFMFKLTDDDKLKNPSTL